MERGDIVRVREYGGRVLTRRVVTNSGPLVHVCNEEEYRRAVSEGREPDGIGFPRDCIGSLDQNEG